MKRLKTKVFTAIVTAIIVLSLVPTMIFANFAFVPGEDVDAVFRAALAYLQAESGADVHGASALPALPQEVREIIEAEIGAELDENPFYLFNWAAFIEQNRVTAIEGGFRIVVPTPSVLEGNFTFALFGLTTIDGTQFSLSETQFVVEQGNGTTDTFTFVVSGDTPPLTLAVAVPIIGADTGIGTASVALWALAAFAVIAAASWGFVLVSKRSSAKA